LAGTGGGVLPSRSFRLVVPISTTGIVLVVVLLVVVVVVPPGKLAGFADRCRGRSHSDRTPVAVAIDPPHAEPGGTQVYVSSWPGVAGEARSAASKSGVSIDRPGRLRRSSGTNRAAGRSSSP
jgi:hypothetical protein